MARPRLAVFKFASCDGCQLTFLAAEDELLLLADRLEIVHFLEASSHIEPGPYDIALVEGSITTPLDLERIREVRRNSKFLITLGACATSGGIQALRNWGNHADFLQAVYARPEYISSLATSTAISEHVKVDFELRGCPIDKQQLLEVLRAIIEGRRPHTPNHSVCLDCKRRGTVCVVVAEGKPCLGPITQSGCGAICPAYDRACYGCFGPAKQANVVSLSEQYHAAGFSNETLVRGLRLFNANAFEFREESNRRAAKICEATTGEAE
jgi:coenzyme F420-reducing hydrogenase gamma subunit